MPFSELARGILIQILSEHQDDPNSLANTTLWRQPDPFAIDRIQCSKRQSYANHITSLDFSTAALHGAMPLYASLELPNLIEVKFDRLYENDEQMMVKFLTPGLTKFTAISVYTEEKNIFLILKDRCPNLQHLSLETAGGVHAVDVLTFIQAHPRLRRLELGRNICDDIKSDLDIVALLTQTQLTALKLVQYFFDTYSAMQFLEACPGTAFPQFKCLNIGSDSTTIVRMLREKTTALEDLRISNEDPSRTLLYCIPYLQCLTSLELAFNEPMTLPFFHLMPIKQFKHLKKLHIVSGSSLSASDIVVTQASVAELLSFMAAFPNLEDFVFFTGGSAGRIYLDSLAFYCPRLTSMVAPSWTIDLNYLPDPSDGLLFPNLTWFSVGKFEIEDLEIPSPTMVRLGLLPESMEWAMHSTPELENARRARETARHLFELLPKNCVVRGMRHDPGSFTDILSEAFRNISYEEWQRNSGR